MARNKHSRSGGSFAKRSLGQNFLVDKNVVRKIVAALGPVGDDLVIEIGPGRGALTQELAREAKYFIAIELDRVFSAALKKQYDDDPSVRIVEADVLTVDFKKIVSGFTNVRNIKIVANLPYNISTAILERLSESTIEFSQAILMFQKEVVSRITAKPGDRARGYLSVITEVSFDTTFLFDVSPKSFKPAPRVRSAVVRIEPRKTVGISDAEHFRSVVSAGFRQKRKTIANNVKLIQRVTDAKALLSDVGVDPRLRPEAITLEDWISISELIGPEAFERPGKQ